MKDTVRAARDRVRRSLLAACVCIVVSAGLPAAIAATPAQTPAEFLRQVYAPYIAGQTDIWPTGPDAPSIFDRRLVALIARDAARHAGEAGTIDADPLCQCQDRGRITGFSIQRRRVTARRAFMSVRFFNLDGRVGITYMLAATPAGWRVADLGGDGYASLAALLETGHGSASSPVTMSGTSASEMLRRLYGSYRDPRRVPEPARDLREIFAARLAALLWANSEKQEGGARGALDRDPFCDCSDFARLTHWSVETVPRAGGQVDAQVRFTDDAGPTRLTYRLVATAKGVRIADIGNERIPSLAGWLESVDGAPPSDLLEQAR